MSLVDETSLYENGPDGQRLKVRSFSGNLLDGIQWDSIAATYPDAVTEIYTYKYLTNLAATITVVYVDSTKEDILSVTRVLP